MGAGEPQGEPHAGQWLGGRYELLEQIGTGSGPVRSWRAYDSLLRRPVRLDIHEPGGPPASRFLECGLAAAATNHPALARVLDAVDEGSRSYIVSAWVDGTPLTRLLADGPLPGPQAVWFLAQLADGVAAAHAANTSLGLRGPDHVFVTPGDTATMTRVPMPGPTREDDVRGLGALMYACLTGYWPLSERSGGLRPAPATGGRLMTPAQLRAGVSADLSALAMGALYPESPTGIRTAAALRDELERRATPPSDVVPFTPPAAPSPTPTKRRRSRAVTVVAPALGIVAVALVAIVIAKLVGSLPNSPSSASTQRQPLSLKSPVTSAHSGSPSHHASSSTSPSSTQAGPIRPQSVSSYNPFNQPPGNDNADEVGATLDGNPGTSWETENYFRSATFGNLKPGVGLLYKFGKPVDVRSIKVTTPTPGIKLEVRSGDSSDGSLDSYTVRTHPQAVQGSSTVAVPSGPKSRYWLVWITSLVPSSPGQFHGAVSEVSFRG